MDPMTALLISGLTQAGMGIYQGINSQRLAKRFDAQEKADFRNSLGAIRENKSLAERQMRQGLAPETKSLYKSQFASDNAKNLRAASEISGGQMSSALGRILALNTLRGGQTLASMDAQARERGQMQMMGVNRDIAAVERAQIQRQMQQEDMTQQQIAGLRQDAVKNVTGAISGYAKGKMYNEYLQSKATTPPD
jgi:uncharacterized protein YdgA (DUF945 family)